MATGGWRDVAKAIDTAAQSRRNIVAIRISPELAAHFWSLYLGGVVLPENTVQYQRTVYGYPCEFVREFEGFEIITEAIQPHDKWVAHFLAVSNLITLYGNRTIEYGEYYQQRCLLRETKGNNDDK